MHNHRWTRIITTFNNNNKKGEGVYICPCNASWIVSTEETSGSSSLKVVHWCINKLDQSWKDMSELVWMGNSPNSIFMHLVEEYVMRSCRYPTVKSHCKVVPNVYIGMYRQFVSLGCCWSMVYILGGCVVCGSCLWEVFARWVYIFIREVWICTFSYWNIRNFCSVVGLCSCRSN